MVKRNKQWLVTFYDIFALNAAMALALILQFNFDFKYIIETYSERFFIGLPILSAAVIVCFVLLRVYDVIWTYASIKDMFRATIAVFVTFLLYGTAHSAVGYGFELSTYILGFVFSVCAVLLFRIVMRVFSRRDRRKSKKKDNSGAPMRTMLIGAGDAANMLLHDMAGNSRMKKEYNVLCAIDDNPDKCGKSVYNVHIVGNCDTIAENVEKYRIEVILFAIPSCPKERRTEILNVCAKTGCFVKTLPSLDRIIDGRAGIDDVRDVQIEDLLGRDPIIVDVSRAANFIRGKTVLVTGGGGSIGSELCRQIAGFEPKRIVIFDIYENNAYNIQNELRFSHPEVDIVTLIGSVRDRERVRAVMRDYRPDIVYHAAAHKHVPLMEDSPHEAIKNNVFGTFHVASASEEFGVKRFVMISTDKAVNPTNIMGATKRICEMIVQSFSHYSETEFVAVRFGNVLGSNGSVIPLFKSQIAAGGPVTVTDKNIIRYFMTIPEAVSLVLYAGASAQGGEIFVLDMGKPVKILTLAENLIRLSGKIPYKDIDIKFTGLRPGEKLYEELLMSEEGLVKTDNDLIFIGHPLNFDDSELFTSLLRLREAVEDETSDIRALVHEIVPTYNYKKAENVSPAAEQDTEKSEKAVCL